MLGEIKQLKLIYKNSITKKTEVGIGEIETSGESK